ncbi:MAG TPA: cyclic nucleotide-gated ion channel [Methylomirabilota bacterium]|nr:cyclic nucleotide-gated ion channel [Methylomirabilota bacterium]
MRLCRGHRCPPIADSEHTAPAASLSLDASPGWRARAGALLADRHSAATPQQRAVSIVLLLSMVVAVADGMLDTLPDLSAGSHRLLHVAGDVAVLVFTLEYLTRLWTAPEAGAAARRRYAVSFLGVVDLLVVLPWWLRLGFPVDDIIVDLAGLLALVKLSRYVPGLSLVAAVFRSEARSLSAAVTALGVLLVLASGVMYVLERDAQPTVFTSIPKTLWWGIVTIASVGYGDMTPVTPLGRIFGGFVILLGIAVFAVPAGILATGFAHELRKRDFVVTWQAVAKVPLFAGLDAAQIADIARLLKPQVAPERYVIVRRGDAADAMYFVITGEVEVEIVPPVRLRAGQFFGEIALLRDTERTASVTAVTECHLLSLGVGDFRRLMQQYPALEAAIRKVADTRRP